MGVEFNEPSYEELTEQIAALQLVTDQQAAECVELRERLDERDARIAELEPTNAALAARLAPWSHQWDYSKRGHRYAWRLSEVQVERYGSTIERGRRFMELLAELDDAEGWAA